MSNITNKNLLSYCLLAFCLAFIGLPIYIYLPNYYADNFGVSLKTIALILLFTRLIDTIQDPIFGILSDKFSILKRKIIFYLAPFLGISFILLFKPIAIIQIEIWLTIFLITTYSLFSIIYINYFSYAVSFSNDYNFKTKIIAYREVAFISGIIFAAAAPAILFEFFSETQSFFMIGLVFLVLISIFCTIFYFFAPRNTYKVKNEPNFSKIFQHRKLRKFFIIFLLNSISSAIPAVLILFFVEDVLNAKKLTGLFLLIYFFGLLMGTIFWTKMSKRNNQKVKTWIIAILFTVFVFSFCYFLKEGDVLFYALICLFSGFGFGGDFSLGYSILTDLIQKYKVEKNETTIFGITNFIVKIALTISSASLIYLIGVFENDVQEKKEFISFSYALLPITFRIASSYLLFKNFKND